MQYIMFTKHLEGLDLDEIIATLQRVGVQGADLCVRPGYPVTPENAATALSDAMRRFRDAGLDIPLVTTPTNFQTPDNPDAENLFSACGAAGVKYIKLGYWHWSPDEHYWDTMARVDDWLQGFAELANRHGVTAVVHNHSGRSLGLNGSAAMQIVRKFDPAHVALFADAGHLSICGEPIDMALDIMRSHLRVCAFKDLVHTTVQRNGRAMPATRCVRMGEGLVDWQTTVEALEAMDFSGPVSFHSEYAGEPVPTVIDLAACDVRFINALRADN